MHLVFKRRSFQNPVYATKEKQQHVFNVLHMGTYALVVLLTKE